MGAETPDVSVDFFHPMNQQVPTPNDRLAAVANSLRHGEASPEMTIRAFSGLV
jgi:hypothetical protein